MKNNICFFLKVLYNLIKYFLLLFILICLFLCVFLIVTNRYEYYRLNGCVINNTFDERIGYTFSCANNEDYYGIDNLWNWHIMKNIVVISAKERFTDPNYDCNTGNLVYYIYYIESRVLLPISVNTLNNLKDKYHFDLNSSNYTPQNIHSSKNKKSCEKIGVKIKDDKKN